MTQRKERKVVIESRMRESRRIIGHVKVLESSSAATSSPQHFLDHVSRHAVEGKRTRKEEGRKAETSVEQRDKYRTFVMIKL